MSKEKRRVPKLRFPGFTEDWEQCKLGDLAEIVRGASPRPISDPKWFDNDSNVGWLRIADVTAQDGRIRYLEQKISELGQEKTRVIKTPHLLLSIAATVGKPVINYVPTGVHDGFLIFLNPKFNILYAFWWLEMFREKWNKYGQPGSQVNLNSDLVKNQVINIPNEKEQEKISSFLESLDKIITLHQRKLEHLNLKKKALLQKLFPKNGAPYPELRFPGFTDAWEQRKLGDFTNQINTFVNPEDAKLPLWSLTAEAGLIEKSDRYERDFLVKKKDQFKRIETNTLVYNPMNITIGSIDIYTGLYPIAVSGYYVSIVYDKNIDTDFLKEVLLLPSSLKMYKNYATGSLIERQRVQYPTFSKLQLLLPNLDEQKAIGQLFKSLNLNITLHQRKLEHLKLQKKALLQQLFV